MLSRWVVWPQLVMFSDILKDRRLTHESYRRIFASPDGQIVLKHLMKKFNVASPTFVNGDTHATAFREGQRHVVLSILKFVNKDINQEIQEQIEDE